MNNTYVMTDIHGEYQRFLQMLQLIEFSDSDTLFILGDVIDRGPEPVNLLKDLSCRSNVYCLMGNHEFAAIHILDTLLVEINDDNYESHIDESVIDKLFEYQQNGGDVTLKQFYDLSHDERLDLLDYLNDLPLYDVVEMNEKTFILSHTGNINGAKKLSQHSVEELLFYRADYERCDFADTDCFVLGGHTPTINITGKPEIYCKNNCINLDCGAVFGGRLACLRLNDFKTFYV